MPTLYDFHVRGGATGILFESFVFDESVVAIRNILRYAIQVVGKGGHYRVEYCGVQSGANVERFFAKFGNHGFARSHEQISDIL